MAATDAGHSFGSIFLGMRGAVVSAARTAHLPRLHLLAGVASYCCGAAPPQAHAAERPLVVGAHAGTRAAAYDAQWLHLEAQWWDRQAR